MKRLLTVLCAVACCLHVASADTLLGRLEHVLQPTDRIETEVRSWVIGQDFFCLFVNGTFGSIDDSEICDGSVVCASGADESEAACHSLERCPPGKVKCPLEMQCLNPSQLCDGFTDCAKDAWDERDAAGCPTGQFANSSLLQCPDGMFACLADVKCLTADALCNFKHDCNDGSDESPSTCPQGQACPENTFRCYKTNPEDGEFFHNCITYDEVCNQVADCPGHEDELADYSPCTLESLLQNLPAHELHRRRHHHDLLKNIVSNGTITHAPPEHYAPHFLFPNVTSVNETGNGSLSFADHHNHTQDAVIHPNGIDLSHNISFTETTTFVRETTVKLSSAAPAQTTAGTVKAETAISETTTKPPRRRRTTKASVSSQQRKSDSAKVCSSVTTVLIVSSIGMIVGASL